MLTNCTKSVLYSCYLRSSSLMWLLSTKVLHFALVLDTLRDLLCSLKYYIRLIIYSRMYHIRRISSCWIVVTNCPYTKLLLSDLIILWIVYTVKFIFVPLYNTNGCWLSWSFMLEWTPRSLKIVTFKDSYSTRILNTFYTNTIQNRYTFI